MAFDILAGEDGELLIDPVTGDIVIGLSDEQHFRDLLLSQKGDFKEYPLAGVGLINYNKSNGKAQLDKEIRLQLKADGAVAFVNISAGETFEIEINGKY
jgi:hypothetical protein